MLDAEGSGQVKWKRIPGRNLPVEPGCSAALILRRKTMKILHRILPFLLVTALPMRAAVNRAVSIEAPAEAAAGSRVSATLSASTDAGDGEQIGFLYAEYSIDEGKTWTQICYAEKSGANLFRPAIFAVNAKGGKAIVRVRVAFRGGLAGDVDYKGDAIQWGDSWQKWRSPPTKYAVIYSPKS
jgi:hypothetical protein